MQEGESFVFVGEEQQRMRHTPLLRGGVQVRTCADTDHPDTFSFTEGIDFAVDYDLGVICRTPASRIPDWSEHVLSGVSSFDHTMYEDYGNRRFTVYVSYEYDDVCGGEATGFSNRKSAEMLGKLLTKLAEGREIVYVVLGDSISAGGDASEEKYAFCGRLASWLESRYPSGGVSLINKAIPGETSQGGAGRVARDIIPLRPDLVTIGYGMNDQNKYEHGNGVALNDFENNIQTIVDDIRRDCDAEIVLVTPCEPNPLWKHTSGQIGEYAEVIRKIGSRLGIAVADAHALWKLELAAGKTPESLLLNNINHPNDYGHRLYFEAFECVFNLKGKVG